MPRITVDLLRKRSEHNECVLSTLEEISLHQEEIEKIEVIGTLCRKLRILYLQNNIIEKIEDLTHMKELRYLNLALNNITKIEGLGSCEFLDKLDLTVNFIDFDTLEESIDHLKPLRHLRELYMLGNPCQSNWPSGFHEYIIASLPQLQMLDGKDIHRSDRIKALQVFKERQEYVREQAIKVRAEKAIMRQEEERQMHERKVEDADVIDIINGEVTDISNQDDEDTDGEREPKDNRKKPSIMASKEKVPYTPHTRREMYMEMAEQKEEEEARRRENMPKERNMEAEHQEALRKTRLREQRDDGSIRQCNEGRWEFRLLDEPLEIILEVDLPRFLDTSLIDVDVHPSYVSMVIKNKILRLRFPELVHSGAGKAERSKVSGTLRLTLPKAHVTPMQQFRAQLQREEQEREKTNELQKQKKKQQQHGKMDRDEQSRTRRLNNQPSKLSDEVLEAVNTSRQHAVGTSSCKGGVKIHGLVKKHNHEQNENEDGNNWTKFDRSYQLTPVVTKTTKYRRPEDNEAREAHNGNVEEEDEDAPPLLY